MKLYSYSGKSHNFIEAKWFIARFVFGGILIGAIVSFGVMELNQSSGFSSPSRSAKILATENNFLRYQVSIISAKVDKLEIQTKQLNECGEKLQMLFHRRKMVKDTVYSLTYATK